MKNTPARLRPIRHCVGTDEANVSIVGEFTPHTAKPIDVDMRTHRMTSPGTVWAARRGVSGTRSAGHPELGEALTCSGRGRVYRHLRPTRLRERSGLAMVYAMIALVALIGFASLGV